MSVHVATLFFAPYVDAWGSATASLGIAVRTTRHGRVLATCNPRYSAQWSNGGTLGAYSDGTLSLTAMGPDGHTVLDHGEHTLWATDRSSETAQAELSGGLQVGFPCEPAGAYTLFVSACVTGGPSIIVGNVAAPGGGGIGGIGGVGSLGASVSSLDVVVPSFSVEVRDD